MAGVAVVFQNESDSKINEKSLRETCSLILRRLNWLDTVEIELLVVGDRKIKRLNKQYRGVGEPTDVLSFPASWDKSAVSTNFLGSIVISVDTAINQAKLAGISLEKELQTLTGHGLLHLLGYHHNYDGHKG